MPVFECFHEDECQYFGERYEPVIQATVHANDLCHDLIKGAKAKAQDQRTNILWMMAASCLMEFEDIFLLAGNGRGTGSIKLLRAFYERVVTLTYLANHPDKTGQFVDFTDVHWKKLLLEAERTKSTASIPPESIERVEENFQKVKDRYQQKCPKCDRTSLQGSWTQKPVPDMASDAHAILRHLAFNAYFRPTFHIHTTYFGIVEQCDRAEGQVRFSDVETQRRMASEVLSHAHILLIQVIDVLNGAFQLGRDEELKAVGDEWKYSWDKVGWPGDKPLTV
jgi:hypothetical protein